jgi:CRISPR/Cas system-associated exonuclease Cas4 (RecB family)
MNHQLPETFVFSQTALSDWRDCKRRFQYRHIQQREYPALTTTDPLPFEEQLAAGEAFHHLVHQYFSGVDEDKLLASIQDEQLQTWWHAFKAHGITDLPSQRYAETLLTGSIGGYRILAKYDLIAVAPNERFVIMDWKTSANRPKSSWLMGRFQTVVYRYLAVQAGRYYNGNSPVQPEQVEMHYWFTNAPTEPEILRYSQQQYEADAQYLTDTIQAVAAEQDFPKVHEEERERTCRYCIYRSLCWERFRAGDLAAMDDDITEPSEITTHFDFDQIAEIEF